MVDMLLGTTTALIGMAAAVGIMWALQLLEERRAKQRHLTDFRNPTELMAWIALKTGRGVSGKMENDGTLTIHVQPNDPPPMATMGLSGVGEA